MSSSMAKPSQNALKFPATKPDRMVSAAPPSCDEVTTSRTWADSVEVNTFTSSGISAPASVPHVMTVDSFHHKDVSPPNSGIMKEDTMYVRAIETSDVSQTRNVSGAS